MPRLSIYSAVALFILLSSFGTFTFFLGQEAIYLGTENVVISVLFVLVLSGVITFATYGIGYLLFPPIAPIERLRLKLKNEQPLVQGVMLVVTPDDPKYPYIPQLYITDTAQGYSEFRLKYQIHPLNMLNPEIVKLLLAKEGSSEKAASKYAQGLCEVRLGGKLYLQVEIPAENATLFDIPRKRLSTMELLRVSVNTTYNAQAQGILCVVPGDFGDKQYVPHVMFFDPCVFSQGTLEENRFELFVGFPMGLRHLFIDGIKVEGVTVKGLTTLDILEGKYNLLTVELTPDIAAVFDMYQTHISSTELLIRHLTKKYPDAVGIEVSVREAPEYQLFYRQVYAFNSTVATVLRKAVQRIEDAVFCDLDDLGEALYANLADVVADQLVEIKGVEERYGAKLIVASVPVSRADYYELHGVDRNIEQFIPLRMQRLYGKDVCAIWISITDVPDTKKAEPFIVSFDSFTSARFWHAPAYYDVNTLDEIDSPENEAIANLLVGKDPGHYVKSIEVVELEGVMVVKYTVLATDAADILGIDLEDIPLVEILEKELKQRYGNDISGFVVRVPLKSLTVKYVPHVYLFQDVPQAPFVRGHIESRLLTLYEADKDLIKVLISQASENVTQGPVEEFVPGVRLVSVQVSFTSAEFFGLRHTQARKDDALQAVFAEKFPESKLDALMVEVIAGPQDFGAEESLLFVPTTLYIFDHVDSAGMVPVNDLAIRPASHVNAALLNRLAGLADPDNGHPISEPVVTSFGNFKVAAVQIDESDAVFFSIDLLRPARR